MLLLRLGSTRCSCSCTTPHLFQAFNVPQQQLLVTARRSTIAEVSHPCTATTATTRATATASRRLRARPGGCSARLFELRQQRGAALLQGDYLGLQSAGVAREGQLVGFQRSLWVVVSSAWSKGGNCEEQRQAAAEGLQASCACGRSPTVNPQLKRTCAAIASASHRSIISDSSQLTRSTYATWLGGRVLEGRGDEWMSASVVSASQWQDA